MKGHTIFLINTNEDLQIYGQKYIKSVIDFICIGLDQFIYSLLCGGEKNYYVI